MDEKLRSTGIDSAGLVPWGAHMCLFYHTQDELITTLAAYFKAGLENNELCVWITSDPLAKEEARLELQRALPDSSGCDFAHYRRLGQIEFYDFKEWYVHSSIGLAEVMTHNVETQDLTSGAETQDVASLWGQGVGFNTDRILKSWMEKEKQARRIGFDGLRVSGDTSWMGVLFQDDKPIAWNHEVWSDLTRYENQVGEMMQADADLPEQRPRMLSLCTYDLNQCSPAEIIEATANHQLTLIREDENCAKKTPDWRVIYSASHDRAEDALEASQKRYQALVESSSDHIFMLSAEGEYLTSNDRVSQFGLKGATQLTGRRLEDVYPTELAESYRQQLERVYATGSTVEFEHPMIQPDGEHTHLDTLYPIYRYGLVWAVGGICHDISERKRSEQAHIAWEERFRAIFEGALDPIFIKDRQLRYTLVNPAMEKLVKLPAEQLVGKNDAQVFGEAEAARLELADHLVLNGEISEQSETLPADGELRLLLIIKTPLRDESGQISGLCGIVRDITRRMQTGEIAELDPEQMSLYMKKLHIATPPVRS